MLQIKYLILTILFYILALLQNSFFVHFNLLGAVPNLVFILFFLMVFFAEKGGYYGLLFYSAIAGFFLDIFSSSNFGLSIILLFCAGFFIKKSQELLKEKSGDRFPIVYFLPLFFIAFTAYTVLVNFFLNNLSLAKTMGTFDAHFVFEIIYNLLIILAVFFIYKRYFLYLDNRQLSLFKK